jgi:hypothetical protein
MLNQTKEEAMKRAVLRDRQDGYVAKVANSLGTKGFFHEQNPSEWASQIGLGDAVEPQSLAGQQFIDSWNHLDIDKYMNDKGDYRYRRHSVLSCVGGTTQIEVREGVPHYQAVSYNQLNGGIERWFSPITRPILDGHIFRTILKHGLEVFELAHGPSSPFSWFIEAHQFRIVARQGKSGQPTPEGVHRDGVDYVMIVLMGRNNIVGGVSSIYSPSKEKVFESSMMKPFEIIYLDDKKVMHGVSAISQGEADAPGIRDTLVITFKKKQ